jgi:hypothetical protein
MIGVDLSYLLHHLHIHEEIIEEDRSDIVSIGLEKEPSFEQDNFAILFSMITFVSACFVLDQGRTCDTANLDYVLRREGMCKLVFFNSSVFISNYQSFR